MNPLTHVILQGDSRSLQLLPDEIEAVFGFAFRVHNHLASTPAQPMFWVRSERLELFRFVN